VTSTPTSLAFLVIVVILLIVVVAMMVQRARLRLGLELLSPLSSGDGEEKLVWRIEIAISPYSVTHLRVEVLILHELFFFEADETSGTSLQISSFFLCLIG
jgi:membrane protein implicated in regulation of membrane protease activity